ncbi:hypothetical protein OJF2_27840 [Aquisphaera giovannonii]|uniref:Bacterial type II and III secretion system protein n=1 Tax=Aquisphaera giovannonii TaxID=406548 RepID=A0A5B9W1W1_9BACT|nr:hypothetical protein [Aquisphaera giovannonii]QEH34249.1 hypothetical protein OJF2_27840 [Aquisphaera giovannonii]
MNRRKAMILTTLLGCLSPAALFGQESGGRKAAGRGKALQPADDERADPNSPDEPPSGLLREPGYQMRTYDISSYTRLDQRQQNPQKAIVEWIFRRTGTADWHGDRIAVLSASRNQLRVYNSPEILKQVDEVVERFTGAADDILAVHVRMYVASDTRWRHDIFSQLAPVGSGPQGQQIWTLRMTDAVVLITQLQNLKMLRPLADERFEMINGQTLTFRQAQPRTFAGGMQRENAAGQGYTPRADKLEESIVLKVSPLLTFDDGMVDASIDLAVNTVRGFHRTKVIAAREQGPPEMSVDVPEVSMTRLDQVVKNWQLGQVLLITGGIHPGVLDSKSGWLGTPIGAPTASEVLVFIDIETAGKANSKASRPKPEIEQASASDEDEAPRRGRPRAAVADESDADPPARSRKPRRATRGPDVDSEDDAAGNP